MTIAPFVENAEDNRKYFAKLRELSVDISAKNIDNVNMRDLSMGMTGDYAGRNRGRCYHGSSRNRYLRRTQLQFVIKADRRTKWEY